MRIGIVGCGAVARRSHLPALRRLAGAEVLVVYDRDEARARAIAAEFKVPRVHTAFDDFAADNSFGIAAVLAPPSAYPELVPLLLKRGKHVLLEKTLAADRAGADCVRRAVEEAESARLGVALNYRYFPAIQRARARLAEGGLGRLVSIHVVAHQHFPLLWDLSVWRFASGAGVLEDLAPHAVDLLLWLADDEPVSVTALGRNVPGQFTFVTHATIAIEFRGGVAGVAEVSWLTGPMMLKAAVHGTGGRLILDPLFGGFDEQHGVTTPVHDARALWGKVRYSAARMLRGEMFWDPGSFYKQVYEDFDRYLRGENPNFPDARWAARTLRVIEAAARSLGEGGTVRLEA